MIFNLGADDPITLIDTAELLIKVSGFGSYETIPFPEERKMIDIGNYYADYRKIRSTLGWSPKVTLMEGLKKTLNFYKKFHKYYWSD